MSHILPIPPFDCPACGGRLPCCQSVNEAETTQDEVAGVCSICGAVFILRISDGRLRQLTPLDLMGAPPGALAALAGTIRTIHDQIASRN